MTIEDRVDAGKDKIKGKTNQVVGDLRDDKSQQVRGHAQELRGEARSAKADIEEDHE